jgi:AcrR family transcriptional regulator
MVEKKAQKQQVARRRPQQVRAQQKVELILEAATILLERGTIETLTTNVVAKTAGISIGTLYQYFDGKHAILSALADREIAALSERVIAALKSPPPEVAGGRIGIIINAILSTHGGRRRAHRLLIEYSLTRRGPSRLNPLHKGIVQMLASGNIAVPGRTSSALSEADAFVLTHALSGVLRAFVAAEDRAPPRRDVEHAMTQMVLGYLSKA